MPNLASPDETKRRRSPSPEIRSHSSRGPRSIAVAATTYGAPEHEYSRFNQVTRLESEESSNASRSYLLREELEEDSQSDTDNMHSHD